MSPRSDQDENQGCPCEGPDSTEKLVSLLADYGQDWQIERQTSPAAWVAVRRCAPPAVEIHCALRIDELRAKLDRAQAGR